MTKIMKSLFIIFAGIASSCVAQQAKTVSHPVYKLEYYSDTCNSSMIFKRKYINDSVFIEQHKDVSDTIVLIRNRMSRIHRGGSYKIIDVTEDFNIKHGYRHFYYGLSPQDTSQKKSEFDTQYKLRLQQSIVIYVPIKAITINNRKIFIYYIVGDCYPAASEKCIESKIMNEQYGILYFEPGIGQTGYAASNSKCIYLIKDAAYVSLLNRAKQL